MNPNVLSCRGATMKRDSSRRGSTRGPSPLEVLAVEASALRTELVTLRQKLASVERDLSAAGGGVLHETNQELVVAAVRAHEIADAARTALERVSSPAAPAVAMARRDWPEAFDDLREANERLVVAALHSQELEEEAKQAYRQYVAFFATVAHELRNPLLPLRLAARMLDRAHDDPEMLAKLQATITGQVNHIARLISDLLDGARVSTGKFRLERVSVDLVRLLALAIESFLPLAEGRHQKFSSAMPAGAVPVFADPVRLVQVFGNLLENASKYTPEGGELGLVVSVQGPNVVVAISDNGIGITPEALPHLFKIFVQDAHAVAFDRAGFGIGLAVVQELVLEHGGAVVATSAGKGRGSQFRVTLPLEVPA
ncbi:HAMP domain-containing histidine kinase [Ramlibacter monticola]|uniref:histidine kinase n=1 Tax=Ramlibacter monticola TaxID=1926872 RepID=A0A936YYV6_9BURK|nr:HAMP domain-containing sensor histidine kinase [Ramlibacter monticola]MBL0391094.1 HAMP domain-containing histidine kinase [Ramlibacter monticola]